MSENQERVFALVMVAVFLVSAYFLARGFAMYTGKGAETLKGRDPEPETRQEVFAEAPEGEGVKEEDIPEKDTPEEDTPEEGKTVKDEALTPRKFCVVVDAGHGGKDPGKVGVNDALEKDINLQIAGLLKTFLEMDDVRVVMTRETDEGLYDENSSNKKVQDMKRRIAIIEEAKPDLVVSIHQNSYKDSSVKGGQVFYYTTAEKSRQLAQIMQKQLQEMDPGNKREAKGNTGYYLLKKTTVPTVIVECGFLSNPQDAALLSEPAYQEKMAFGIHMGVMKYLNSL